MTLISQLITDAYQANNLIALGSIPTAAEQDKALRYLNRIFQSMFGNELGERLSSINVGSVGIIKKDSFDYKNTMKIIPSNTRIVLNTDTPLTIYLPSNPEPGTRVAVQDNAGTVSVNPVTVQGNGRTISGLPSLLVDSNRYNEEFFFREDLGDWVRVTSLGLGDEFPLPLAFEEYIITMLVLRLDPSAGVSLDQQLGAVMQQMSRKIRARYKQSTQQQSDIALLRLSSNSRNYTNSASAEVYFNNG
jgi:hypothetical protein